MLLAMTNKLILIPNKFAEMGTFRVKFFLLLTREKNIPNLRDVWV